MPRYHVRITGQDYDVMADLVRKYKITVARHTVEKLKDGYRVDAHANGTQIRRLEAAGYKVERIEDADQAGKKRQVEFKTASKRKPTRAARAAPPTRYLSNTEVESALAALVTPPNDSFTQLITLPNKTWEDRVCHAIKIGNGSGQDRPGIYFLGGVHAREWGSLDILINFAQQLTQAYSSGTGISIGSKNFTASRIRSISPIIGWGYRCSTFAPNAQLGLFKNRLDNCVCSMHEG